MSAPPALTHKRRLGPGTVLRVGSAAEYRAVTALAGEPHVLRHELVGSPQGFRPGPAIACFGHLSDLHVTDVQSPGRFEFINREYLDPRFRELLPMQRPQEALNVHAIAAMVRTVNAMNVGPLAGRPLELAIMSGDAVDNAQWNELMTFLALLDGGRVDIDSGGPRYEGVQAPGWPDDIFWKPDGPAQGGDQFISAFGFPLVPRLLERALLPFEAEGLVIPWLGCHGNHEEVCQGVGIVTPRLAAAMVGFHKPYRLPNDIDRDSALEMFVHAPDAFMTGPDLPVTPDAGRRPFTRGEFVDAHIRHGARPDGHGFRADGRANYVYDTSAVRFIVLDTVCAGGGADGCIDQDEMVWLQARLEEVHSSFRAADGTTVRTSHANRLVVVISHHTLDTLVNQRGAGRSRYVGAEELIKVVHRFDNVVLWLNGHIHGNAIRPRADPDGGGGGFWEVTTCSLVDWPCQARIVEIFEAGDGLLAVGCTMVDHDSPLDHGGATDSAGMAALHRELAANAPVVGFGGWREGMPADRNAVLLVRRPF